MNTHIVVDMKMCLGRIQLNIVSIQTAVFTSEEATIELHADEVAQVFVIAVDWMRNTKSSNPPTSDECVSNDIRKWTRID